MAPERGPEVTKGQTWPPASATAARTRTTSTTKAPVGDRSPGPLSDQMSGTVEIVRLLAATGKVKVFFGAWVEIATMKAISSAFASSVTMKFLAAASISPPTCRWRALLKKRLAIWPSSTRRRAKPAGMSTRSEYVGQDKNFPRRPARLVFFAVSPYN